jgi:hypothetical protein
MATVVVLDSGPLGDACRRRGHPDVEDLRWWLILAMAKGVIVAVPEISDYEVRRGLLWAVAIEGVERLDELRNELGHYIPITTAAMHKAAALWADARRRGLATDDEKEIDADVILAAQALLFTGLTDNLIVATDNARHLSRYVDARHWGDITP